MFAEIVARMTVAICDAVDGAESGDRNTSAHESHNKHVQMSQIVCANAGEFSELLAIQQEP